MTDTNLPYALNEDGVPTPDDAQAALEAATPPFLALAQQDQGPTGWHITVLRTSDAAPVHTLVLRDWTTWRPASAGHRLIEAGYMLPAAAHFAPGREAGWLRLPTGNYAAPAYTSEELAG